MKLSSLPQRIAKNFCQSPCPDGQNREDSRRASFKTLIGVAILLGLHLALPRLRLLHAISQLRVWSRSSRLLYMPPRLMVRNLQRAQRWRMRWMTPLMYSVETPGNSIELTPFWAILLRDKYLWTRSWIEQSGAWMNRSSIGLIILKELVAFLCWIVSLGLSCAEMHELFLENFTMRY